MKILDKICEKVNFAYLMVGSAFLIMLVVSCVVQVYTRYIVNKSQPWTEEMARYCFIWINMLGASVCVRASSHSSVSALTDLFPSKMRKWYKIVVLLFVIIFALVMLVQSSKIVGLMVNKYSVVMKLPLNFINLSVVFSAAGIILQAVNNLIQQVALARGKGA
jgi:TRAP-type C4-dicarboxylate transport system permease small subunit